MSASLIHPASQKIALLSHTAALGGAERSLLELVIGLSGSGFDVHLIVPADGPLRSAAQAAGATTSTTPASWWVTARDELERAPISLRARRAVAIARDVLKMRKLLRNVDPDLTVTSSAVAPTLAIAAWTMGIPHVWYVHEFVVADHDMRFIGGRRASHSIIGRLSRQVLACSDAVAKDLSGTIGRLPITVPYAVEVDTADMGSSAPQGADMRIIIVGTIHPGKGQADAVRALRLLDEAGVAATLTIVGGGRADHVRELQELAVALAVDARVRFTGHAPNPFPHFLNADVALTCSRSEAFGRVTVEAMKCGLPVVGTSTGGTPDLFEHGTHGFLYEPGDIAQLAAALCELWRNPSRRRAMGEAARRDSIRRFSIEVHTRSFLSAVGLDVTSTKD